LQPWWPWWWLQSSCSEWTEFWWTKNSVNWPVCATRRNLRTMTFGTKK
jgi:hypothetical protein